MRQSNLTERLHSFALKLLSWSRRLCIVRDVSCQCSRQEANSNLKIGFSFRGNPRLKVFLLPHARGGSLLIARHLCAFRLDYKSRADRMELPSPEGNPKLHDRIGNISENRSWEETWKSLAFNQEGCQNRCDKTKLGNPRRTSISNLRQNATTLLIKK